MGGEKREGAALGPGAPAPEAFEKPRMAARLNKGGLEPVRLGDGGARQSGGGHEGVVEGIDQERRSPDLRQELGAARPSPVVVLAGEAVERGRHQAIVLGEGLRLERCGKIEDTLVKMGLLVQL